MMSLWRVMASETAIMCGTSAIRDIKTVADRVECEGDSFFTITLPKFGKAFERALELRRFDSSLLTQFEFRGRLPKFLRGYVSQVFDPSSGLIHEQPCVEAIRSVRQLTLMFGKIFLVCDDSRVRSAMQKYVEIEQELAEFDFGSFDEVVKPRFLEAVTLLYADVFSHVESSILDKHGVRMQYSDPPNGLGYPLPWYNSERGVCMGAKGPDPMDIILGVRLLVNGVLVQPGLEHLNKYEERSGVEREIVDPARSFSFVPRHGPGATADRVRGNAKFSLRHWSQRAESMFPYGDYALPQLACEDELERVQFLEPGMEIPAKVVPVPKTKESPRLIAEEPAGNQYLQQGLFRQIVYRLEHSFEIKPPSGEQDFDLSKWFLGFAEQEPNRVLALEGSQHGRLATLDLSEASDRVSNRHVILLFSRNPVLSRALQSTRSTHASVPGHGVIPLAKFASMGSAVCFPVEAMVFLAIVIAAIADDRRSPVNRRLLSDLRGKVRIYGDDIVVPVDHVQRVIQYLELSGLKVNSGKSFWNGSFRESCGGDYYDGEWVTPVRLRKELPSSLADVEGVVGLVAFRNLLYWNGYWSTAAYLDEYFMDLFRGSWSVVETTAAGLGRESVLPYEAEWHSDLDGMNEPRVRGAIVKSKIPDSPITGSGALLKFLIKPGVTPSQDEKHLERQGRPERSHIKLRGIRPY
jgi:hypothetical protein